MNRAKRNTCYPETVKHKHIDLNKSCWRASKMSGDKSCELPAI